MTLESELDDFRKELESFDELIRDVEEEKIYEQIKTGKYKLDKTINELLTIFDWAIRDKIHQLMNLNNQKTDRFVDELKQSFKEACECEARALEKINLFKYEGY